MRCDQVRRRGRSLKVLTDLVFVDGEVRLDVRFDVARARLVSLLRGSTLLAASQDAYSDGAAALTRPRPQGSMRAISRLVEVKFQGPAPHGNAVLVALRWEVIGPDGKLFPALDADIMLAPAGRGATLLRLDGAYRLPAGAPGGGAGQVILHRVAAITVRGFLDRIEAAITDSVRNTSPDGRGRPSSLPPETEVS